MKTIQNTLYITQENCYVNKQQDSVIIRKDKSKIAQFPLTTINQIVCFGFSISCSPELVEHCSLQGITVTWLNSNGKFLARLQGPVQGNVLLRRAQYKIFDDSENSLQISKATICSKIQNQKSTLLRFVRNHGEVVEISEVDKKLTAILSTIKMTKDINTLRGFEGFSSELYFSVFDSLVLNKSTEFLFEKRTRRPPLNRINAVLSYVYSILTLDIRSALESVGLDPFVGFMHVERPGRPSLALDMVEEFRSSFADRLVLSLVNKKQIQENDFKILPTGEVQLSDNCRKVLLTAYQLRKREIIHHPYFDEDVEIGVLFLLQSRLLARHIRGDIDFYPAFIWR
jgi:CRISPR-associated protein Cas1